MMEILGKMRKVELLPARDYGAGYAPDLASVQGRAWYMAVSICHCMILFPEVCDSQMTWVYELVVASSDRNVSIFFSYEDNISWK